MFVHMDKASSHTSKSTVKQIETGISFIPFSGIPTKSPDLFPMEVDLVCWNKHLEPENQQL